MLTKQDKKSIEQKNLDRDLFLKYKSHFKGIRAQYFSKELEEFDFETTTLEREQLMMTSFGLQKHEVDFIMRQKPSFLFQKEDDRSGIFFLDNYIVQELGFSLDQLRYLIVKYPAVLSKERRHFQRFFDKMQQHQI